MKTERPMLAVKVEPDKVRFPILGSPKLDGIRCRIRNGVATSRSGKPLPNEFVQKLFGTPLLEGLDGELIVGPPNAEDVFFQSDSGVMSKSGEPDVAFYVFDKFDARGGFAGRLIEAEYQIDEYYEKVGHERGLPVVLLAHVEIADEAARAAFRDQNLELGYEGVMYRDPNGAYKNGRSTVKEGGLLKDKPKETIEVVVLEVIEAQANTNSAKKDELGFTKRSSAKAGKVGKGTCGALRVRRLGDENDTVGFKVGFAKGINAAAKQAIYDNPDDYIGQTGVIEFIPVGIKKETNTPRSGRWKGKRSEIDLTSDDDSD